MDTNKPLVNAGYLLSVLLVVTPFFDATLPVLPVRMSDERWRWAVAGQLSNLFLIPLLGLILAIVVASVADHRRVKRVVGTICGILALVLAAVSVLFVLDYLQIRDTMVPKAQHMMSVASSGAIIKNVLSIVTLALLSRAGFAGPTVVTTTKTTRVVAPESSPLISTGAARGARVVAGSE